jgi:hypothetical protein
MGARGSEVGWGAMLQARRSRVRVPMRSLIFFPIYLILSVPEELSAGKARPARKADTLTAVCEPEPTV